MKDDKIFTFYANVFSNINQPVSFKDIMVLISKYKEETKIARELYKKNGKEDPYKSYKSKTFPGVTFNASMKPHTTHRKENIICPSGFIMLDYDGVDNIEELTECVSKIQYTSLVYKSPSGVGIKVLVKVKKEDNFYKLFHRVDGYYTNEIYKHTGLSIVSDKQCSNINRLSFLCYDENPYYNEEALTFDIKEKDVPKIEDLNGKTYVLNTQYEKLLSKIIDRVCELKIDVTENYDDWIRIGFVIRNIIVDFKQGLSYFLKIGQYNSKFDKDKSELKYKSIFDTPDTGKKVKIPTLLRIIEKKGINISLTTEENTIIRDSKIQLQDCKQIMIDEGFIVYYCVIKKKRILKYKDKSFLIDESGNETIHFLRGWFLDIYSYNISNGDIDMIIDNVPRVEYNFVKDILEANKTTDESEIEKVLENFISLNEDRDKNEMLMRFFMGCVYNWCRDTSERKYDEMLILRSDYSIGKTHLINDFLFKIFKENNGITYITESTNFYENDKDKVYSDLTSLINYKPELSDSIRKKSDAIKSYISKKTFTMRRAYKRTEETFSSYTTFIGDTNNTYFLPEDTNNRRFLVLELKELTFMELDYHTNKLIKKDINWLKFWGSIYQLYLNGMRPEDYFKIDIKDNDNFVSIDRDHQILSQILSDGNEKEWIHIDSLIPHIEANGYRLSDTNKQKISNSLTRLGFKSYKKWDKDIQKTTRGWYNIKINDSITVLGGTIVSNEESKLFIK